MSDSLYMLKWSNRSYFARYTVILVTSRDCNHITWSRNPAFVSLLATRISLKLLYCNDIIILNVFINKQRNHCTYFLIANIILQTDQSVCVFHKKSKSIIWFITIDAITFTSDLFANLNRLIKLRCNAFLMFFEFMIALFAHELLSRKLVILFFDSIRREIDENSRRMFDFKRLFFFLFLILIIFHFERAIFEFVIEIVNDAVDELMTNRNTLRTICDSLTKYNRIRVC